MPSTAAPPSAVPKRVIAGPSMRLPSSIAWQRGHGILDGAAGERCGHERRSSAFAGSPTESALSTAACKRRLVLLEVERDRLIDDAPHERTDQVAHDRARRCVSHVSDAEGDDHGARREAELLEAERGNQQRDDADAADDRAAPRKATFRRQRERISAMIVESCACAEADMLARLIMLTSLSLRLPGGGTSRLDSAVSTASSVNATIRRYHQSACLRSRSSGRTLAAAAPGASVPRGCTAATTSCGSMGVRSASVRSTLAATTRSAALPAPRTS